MSGNKNERIYFYDNLKFILITLVVIGHFVLFLVNDLEKAKAIFLWIYSFHMPLFIFITGFLSKKLTNSKGDFCIDKIFGLLLLYFLFKLGVYAIAHYGFNENEPLSMVMEYDCPWYLLALASWIVITYIFKNIKPVILFVCSIISALCIGYDQGAGAILCFSRVIVFYPFFLAGYLLSKENMMKIIDFTHKFKFQLLAFSVIAITLSVFLIFVNELYYLRPYMTGQNAYFYINMPYDFAFSCLFTRLFVCVISIVIGLAIFALTPTKKRFFTYIGSRTMQIYIFHYLVYVLVKYTELTPSLISKFGEWSIIIYIIFSICLTFALSTRWLEKPIKKVLSIDYSKIMNK